MLFTSIIIIKKGKIRTKKTSEFYGFWVHCPFDKQPIAMCFIIQKFRLHLGAIRFPIIGEPSIREIYIEAISNVTFKFIPPSQPTPTDKL